MNLYFSLFRKKRHRKQAQLLQMKLWGEYKFSYFYNFHTKYLQHVLFKIIFLQI